jgi:hypothetical protein
MMIVMFWRTVQEWIAYVKQRTVWIEDGAIVFVALWAFVYSVTGCTRFTDVPGQEHCLANFLASEWNPGGDYATYLITVALAAVKIAHMIRLGCCGRCVCRKRPGIETEPVINNVEIEMDPVINNLDDAQVYRVEQAEV